MSPTITTNSQKRKGAVATLAILLVIGIVASSAYSFISTLGEVPMSWPIFFFWFTTLVSLNSAFLFVFCSLYLTKMENDPKGI